MGNIGSWALQCSAFTLTQSSLPLFSVLSVRQYQAGEDELRLSFCSFYFEFMQHC